MKSLFNTARTARILAWTRNHSFSSFSLLLAAVALSALQLFSPSALSPASLRAQDLPAFTPSGLPDLAGIKAAKKPTSDKWVFSLLPVGLQKNPQVDYAIVTEMTDEGRKLPDPSFEHPVYYLSHSMGQRDVGDAYGGTKPIPYAYLEKQLNNSLASNGYRPTDADHPPTQLLIFTWGMHNKIDTSIDDTDTGDSGDGSDDGSGGDSGASSFSGNSLADTNGYANLLSRAKIVGGKKFADEYAQAMMEGSMAMRQFSQRDETTETLCYEVQNECYYLLVTALDIDALQRHERRVLWTTTISTISQGVSFESTLPIMVNNASYFFGRETNGAEIVRKRAYKRADVSIGEAQVVEYITGSTSSSGTAGAAKTPAPANTPAPATSGTAAGK